MRVLLIGVLAWLHTSTHAAPRGSWRWLMAGARVAFLRRGERAGSALVRLDGTALVFVVPMGFLGEAK